MTYPNQKYKADDRYKTSKHVYKMVLTLSNSIIKYILYNVLSHRHIRIYRINICCSFHIYLWIFRHKTINAILLMQKLLIFCPSFTCLNVCNVSIFAFRMYFQLDFQFLAKICESIVIRNNMTENNQFLVRQHFYFVQVTDVRIYTHTHTQCIYAN